MGLGRDVRVFVSVGRQCSQDQEVCVGRIVTELRAAGLDPRRLPHRFWNEDAPLRPIRAFMRQCVGVVVIALPRIRYESGIECPDTTGEVKIGHRYLPTIWLQIEAALALGLGLPTLILVDNRLHLEGLLNPEHGTYSALTFDIAECQRDLPGDIQSSLRDFSEQLQRTT